MDNRNIAPRCVNYKPPRLLTLTTVANQPAENNDAQGTDDEIITPVSQLPDHLWLEVFKRVSVRVMNIAATLSRRFNLMLADGELPAPVAGLASESSPWYFIDSTTLADLLTLGNVDYSLAYDPVSDRWRRFMLTYSRRVERTWIWNKISSADGLVCAPYNFRGCVSLLVLDPYTVRSRYLPQFQEHVISQTYQYRPGVELSTNIWMIDPADCHYQIIVSRSRMVERLLPEGVEFLVVFYIDSYDKVSNTWRTQFWEELPSDCIITGSSTICRNILYNIVLSKSLERSQAEDESTQFFLHQYDLARNEIVLPQLIALVPCSLCSSPSPTLVNCNDDLVLVGFKGRGVEIRAIVIWRFNPRTHTSYKWRKLGVMPRRYFRILTPSNLFNKDIACTGGGNIIYFRNIGSTRLVVVDVSQMDHGRLRREAWKEASPYPTPCPAVPPVPWPVLRHHFCYEPRLFLGTNRNLLTQGLNECGIQM